MLPLWLPLTTAALTLLGTLVRNLLLAPFHRKRSSSSVSPSFGVAASTRARDELVVFSREEEKSLEKRYGDASMPASIPDPNEALAIAKRLGTTVERVNGWFKQRRAADRNSVKASRFAESGWRLLILAISVGVYLATVASRVTTVPGGTVLETRTAVHFQIAASLHFLISHIVSGIWNTCARRTTTTALAREGEEQSLWRMEFWTVLAEQALRVAVPLSLIAFLGGEEKEVGVISTGVPMLSGYALASKLCAARDACDVLVETSKLLSLLSRHALSLYTFMVLVFSWGWLRVYIQYTMLRRLVGFPASWDRLLRLDPLVGPLVLSLMVDVYGFFVLLRTAKTALWDGRTKRIGGGQANAYHSQSSLSATDLDSDSSLSSQLKHHED